MPETLHPLRQIAGDYWWGGDDQPLPVYDGSISATLRLHLLDKQFIATPPKMPALLYLTDRSVIRIADMKARIDKREWSM